jgi:magnesium chelatase subunit D
MAEPDSLWPDAVLAAALLAIDPAGLGGAAVRAGAGPVRDEWLSLLRRWLPAGTPWQRVPLHIQDERLLGGMDLSATLARGQAVAQRGVLAAADGGVVLLPMAERLSPSTAARLCAVLDTREVQLQRDGLSLSHPARLAVVALDEGESADEALSPALADRLAFRITLTEVSPREVQDALAAEAATLGLEVEQAREILARVQAPDAAIEALCEVAQQLGVPSLRAPWLALRVACAHAALDGEREPAEHHLSTAARLVLAPRATRLPVVQEPQSPAEQTPPAQPSPTDQEPSPPEPQADRPEDAPEEPSAEESTPQPEHEPDGEPEDEPDSATPQEGTLQDRVLAAAQAAIPAGLLALLAQATGPRSAGSAQGAGASRLSLLRGRPLGTRHGRLGGGARLHLLDTLRAAAPWQRLRQAQSAQAGAAQRVRVRPEDFHIQQFRQPRETTTVFVVDASGSSALNRLGEAKGAVELLLADCYVRRDKVAVLAFRGRSAELLLPPTRSLVRAKRSLSGLPGGGGTPIAHALDAAAELVTSVQRRGDSATVVLLTDGKANVTRAATGGRPQAEQDAHAAALRLRLTRASLLLIDTSPQPTTQARALAQAMAARYLPLPQAGALQISQAVRLAGLAGTAVAGSARV